MGIPEILVNPHVDVVLGGSIQGSSGTLWPESPRQLGRQGPHSYSLRGGRSHKDYATALDLDSWETLLPQGLSSHTILRRMFDRELTLGSVQVPVRPTIHCAAEVVNDSRRHPFSV